MQCLFTRADVFVPRMTRVSSRCSLSRILFDGTYTVLYLLTLLSRAASPVSRCTLHVPPHSPRVGPARARELRLFRSAKPHPPQVQVFANMCRRCRTGNDRAAARERPAQKQVGGGYAVARSEGLERTFGSLRGASNRSFGDLRRVSSARGRGAERAVGRNGNPLALAPPAIHGNGGRARVWLRMWREGERVWLHAPGSK